MLFNSLQFLIFFPCVFLLYYLLPHRFRKYMLLVASYYFYMCWKPEFVLLILFCTALNYFCSLGMEKYSDNQKLRKGLLWLSLVGSLGVLFFYKYFNFFGENITALCRALSIPFSVPVLNILLPAGISFFTFQTLSYTIDVYRGKMQAEKDFIVLALFVSFFPQLVAGPIEKASSLLPQLKKEHSFSYENATWGLKLMMWGFFKKLVVADRLAALFVDPVYNNLSAYSGGALVLASCAFAIQIYCDFGGYSDIARGCAKMMGVDLMVNFKAPYLARTVGEFWRRSHRSLGLWFREYVYIPLGGNRKGKAKQVLFIWITFMLSGLWHGAAWTFVFWGALQALFISIEAVFGIKGGQSPVGRIAAMVWVFVLTTAARVFFRASCFSDALYVLKQSLVGLSHPWQYIESALVALNPGIGLAICLFFSLALLLAFDICDEKRDPIAMVSALPVYVRWPLYVLFLLMLVLLIPKQSASPFIYFQF